MVSNSTLSSGRLLTGAAQLINAKNTVISSNILVWKFCGKAQFRHSFGLWKFCGKTQIRLISSDSPKTMQKLCLSTTFLHENIRWNYGIFRSVIQPTKWDVAICCELHGFAIFRLFILRIAVHGKYHNFQILFLYFFSFSVF